MRVIQHILFLGLTLGVGHAASAQQDPDPQDPADAAEPNPPARENFTLQDHSAFVYPPTQPAQTQTGKPWVWYAPTLGTSLPGQHERWMFERLHAAGIAIAGIDVGESYGSPDGRALFQALYEEMTQQRGYSTKPVLLARSRGGLMLYNWAVEHPDCLAAVAAIYPVCDLLSYPGLNTAAPAYGMTPDELLQRLDQHNPIDRLAPLAQAQVPIFHLQGDSDATVPHEDNTAILAQRYEALGGPVQFQLIPRQGHTLWPGWFQSQPLTDFMIQHALGIATEEPPAP